MDLVSSSLNTLAGAANELRAAYYPRNETERRVFEALSSKNWGASTTLMNDIASDTTDYEKFSIVMKTIWSTLDVSGKSWKQIFKALTLVEFLVKNGAERVIEEARDHTHVIRPLQDFNYYEGNVDKGSGVREKAKQLLELLSSNESIRTERDKAKRLKDKFIGISNSGGIGGGVGSTDSYSGGGYSSGGLPSSSKYSSGGIGSDSYSSGGIGNSNYNGSRSDTRYGGGSHDSSRPGRYSDEGDYSRDRDRDSRKPQESRSRHTEPEPEDDDEELPKPVKTKSKKTKETSTGGKLKVTIKDASAPAAPAHVAPPAPAAVSKAPEIDLFGGSSSGPDFFSSPAAAPVVHTPAPAPAAASNFGVFDPFGPSSAAAPVVQQQPATVFDPFASAPAPPAFPAQMNAFPPAAPVMPAYGQTQSNNFGAFAVPASQPQLGGFQQNMMSSVLPTTPVQMQQQYPTQVPQQQAYPVGFGQGSSMAALNNGFNGMSIGVNNGSAMGMQSQPSNNMGMGMGNIAIQPKQGSSEQEFGDFESVNPNSAPVQTNSNSKWNEISGLVDLGSITSNEDPKAKQSKAPVQQAVQNSFAGLDGFQKSSGSGMMNAPKPLAAGLSHAGAPMPSMGLSAMAPRPGPVVGMGMGMGMQPSQMAPQMGLSGGAPMAPYGAAPMGYPAAQAGGMGMGMAQPGFPQQYPGAQQQMPPGQYMGQQPLGYGQQPAYGAPGAYPQQGGFGRF